MTMTLGLDPASRKHKKTAAPSLPDIVLEENMNQPPRIFAIAPGTGQKSLLMDLNPQFQGLALARVEEVAWKTSRHNEVKGGLYWPLDYVAGKKYPLVIQTHGWSPDRFCIDGPLTTAFAAQALAGKGFFVLQVPISQTCISQARPRKFRRSWRSMTAPLIFWIAEG